MVILENINSKLFSVEDFDIYYTDAAKQPVEQYLEDDISRVTKELTEADYFETGAPELHNITYVIAWALGRTYEARRGFPDGRGSMQELHNWSYRGDGLITYNNKLSRFDKDRLVSAGYSPDVVDSITRFRVDLQIRVTDNDGSSHPLTRDEFKRQMYPYGWRD